MSALLVIQMVEAALNLAVSMGINVSKLNAMRELSPDGHLTLAQQEMLADMRDKSVQQL